MDTSILFQKHLGPKQSWGQLYGASLALAIAEYCQETHGIKLIIAPDNLTANQLHSEITFFLPENFSQEILLFPDWETLPYDEFSPHQDIISERLRCLSRLQQTNNALIISSVSTLMHRLCPPSFLIQHGLVLAEGQKLNIATFRNQLESAGYYCVNKVLEHGEFAVRGALIDLFPMGSSQPFRIELFDDEVDSLRRFDPETQRTIDKIKAINILPAREYGLDETSITQFRRGFRTSFTGNPSHCPLYDAISQGQTIGGIEYYLPLFFEETATIFDYLPDEASILLVDATQTQAEHFWTELTSRYQQRNFDISRPLLAPDRCFIPPNTLLASINQYTQVRLSQESVNKKGMVTNYAVVKAPLLNIERNSDAPLAKLADYINKPNNRYLLIVESAGRREVLSDLLKQHNISPTLYHHWHDFLSSSSQIAIITGPLNEGFELTDTHTICITESQIFGNQMVPTRRSSQKSVDPDLIIRDLAELRVGAPVVHLQFGVGRYQGLQYIETNGSMNEFLILSYANQDKIYVPVTALNYISRYTGSDSEHAPLHRLGSDLWGREKKKAQEKIHDVAVELLEIYAKREAKPGHIYTLDEQDYQRFATGFPFEETNDQLSAIEAIIDDFKSTRPMDRLICGDVGFGKTEVAMRAAFLAVQNDRQVCVLVPTTLLAGQHFETFRDRFADFPIHIELLSRFRSAKESEKVMQQLDDGRVDIVIATHKILQKNVKFKNLGLLIIDEEHRFGVKQKEAIKALRNEVDILSMTATPIPRTLNMTMAGIRDISLIATPPAKRLAIKTFWLEHNNTVIQEALLREILRGGQVFYLHNDINTIARVAEDITNLVPEAKVTIAHGQMRERDLERVMSDFYHHRFNVLVCTTIIETGIDIPTANTIIIDRADKFGLAQLHQLRGRVGRSHHQAYAYLITANKKHLTSDAVKRLEALVSHEDLGAGFILATHDLEIRGAGEFLGDEQSGNMHAIGFTLFMEMLEKAVSDLKSGKTPELSNPANQGPEIELRISTIIPEAYIADTHTRLILYKRIASAKDSEHLRTLQIEMIDRFGLLPDTVKNLIQITELKFLADKAGIARINGMNQLVKIEFSETPNIDSMALIKLLQLQPKRYQMDGPTRFKITLDGQSAPERILEISMLIKQISN